MCCGKCSFFSFTLVDAIHNITGVKIKQQDSKKLLYICIVLFLLLTSNGILSPLRDTLGTSQGKDTVSYLVSMSTVAIVAISPLTSYIAKTALQYLWVKFTSVVLQYLVFFFFCFYAFNHI